MSEERGREPYRANTDGLSSYYRDRFGDHSPEEYMNLRISGIDDRMEREEIKMKLTNEFRKFAPFEIKVVRNPDEDERLAYVNFERRECAKQIRYKMMERLRHVLGSRVLCDPAGILRDQEGKYIPDRFNRALQSERSSGSSRSSDRNRGKEPPQWRLKKDDSDATRTLFVGNMPADVREKEIRHVFEKYGRVEDIDIKTPVNTDAAYAFVMFQTVEQAIFAKREEQERPIRSGGPRVKIGYGKSQPSRRLWVGGLGNWCTHDILANEFDRYGLIDRLDYEDGDDVAYITFEDLNAAQDACHGMRNFPLGGPKKCITVDFAKDPSNPTGGKDSGAPLRKRRASTSPLGTGSSRAAPGSTKTVVRNFEELDDDYASTWQGGLLLKKTEYAVKFYRIFGSEKLLQKFLRDEDGNAMKLHITQRLSLASQDSLQDRLLSCSSREMCLVVITAKKELDDARPLVRYLTDKDASGVVSLPSAILYLFPYCDLSSRLLSAFSPNIRLLTDGSPFLLGALSVKSQSPQESPSP